MRQYTKGSCFGFSRLVLAVFSLGLLATGCGVNNSTASSHTGEQGTLHGTVTAAPTYPVETPDDPRRGNLLAGQQIRIEAQSGILVMTITTNDQGEFSTLLPAGHYLVHIQAVRFPMRQRISQIAVTVVAGQTSEVNIVLDSGIR